MANETTTSTLRLTLRHWRVLDALAVRGWTPRYAIPDGNGHTSSGGAKSATLRELCENGLIERCQDWFEFGSYRITEAGRTAKAPKVVTHD